MKSKQAIDNVSETIDPEVKFSVYDGSKAKTEKRFSILEAHYDDADKLRKVSGQIKQHTIEHLDKYLEQAETQLKANGAHVHFAVDGDSANQTILDIMNKYGAQKMVKAKSMVSEETELLPFLEKNGKEAVETDLGEFIIQIDGDHPSHIVTPIVHKNRRQIARSFEREGLGDYNDDPKTITHRARDFLRPKYMEADVGLTGANFISAESGRMVLVTNEGNGRFSLAGPRIHIAMIGIEKLVPKDRDLAVMLNLLGRSATGQQLTVYTQFINGPRAEGRKDGPEHMHVIFIDNKRTEVLAGKCREILRCIRCGACLNICPVYRQAGGHAYRSVYPGPVGAVLSPLLTEKFEDLSDLPKACSVCGACSEVCPANIPIHELLLKLRDRAKIENCSKAKKGTPPMGAWAILATLPFIWKIAMKLGRVMNFIPHALFNIAPPAKAWRSCRDLPEWKGGNFRKWMKTRK